MCKGGLGIDELSRRMRIAVQRKNTAGAQRLTCQRVIKVLASGIAIEFNCDVRSGRRRLRTHRRD